MDLTGANVLRTVSALAIATAACGGDGGTNQSRTPTQIAIQSGNNQVAAAGSALAPLEVVVRDAASEPVPDVTVNWAVGIGGGSVSAPSTTTNASGVASVTRTLGANAGAHTTTATRAGLIGSPLTFSATATVQGATQMALSAGNSQTDTVLATLPTAYAVLVRDHNNQPVANVTVNWSASGGSIAPASSQTNASGIATATRTLGDVAGNQTAQATVAGLMGSPVAFTATATAGNAAALLKLSGSGDGGTAVINSTVNYTATVQDQHGNAKQGVTVNWEVTSGGGTIAPGSSITGATGQASATRTLSGTSGAHGAIAFATLAGGPDTVTFTTNASTAPATATVIVGDNVFNPATVDIAVGGTVTWDWGSGGPVHNVTFSTAGAPGPIANRNSGTVGLTFPNAGTFNYECTIHSGVMTGTVVVVP